MEAPGDEAADAVEAALGTVVIERMPGLAGPFALVGASSAFFTVLGLGVFEAARSAAPLIAIAVAAVAGAAVGATLRRWRGLHDPFRERSSRMARVALLVVIAGAVVGAALGASTSMDYGARSCAAAGALCALGFVPSCLVVLDAGRRAARARFGSLVAEVDRRTIDASLLAVVAFASVVQSPALALSYTCGIPPVLQGGLSLGVGAFCAASIAFLWRRDRNARARIEEIGRDAPSLDRADAGDLVAEAALDLGLGADRWARDQALATYRTFSRPEVVLRGSVHEARWAIDGALRHRRRALAFALAMVGVTFASIAFGTQW